MEKDQSQQSDTQNKQEEQAEQAERGSAAYEQKKQERQERKERERKEHRRAGSASKLKNYAITALVIVAVGYGIYLLAQNATPQSEDMSRAVELMSPTHIPEGSELPEYTSNPPTSGPHYGVTARSGFRDEAISDQNIIHNLEHGDIWISYKPSVAGSVVEELKQFGAAKVIITPREANETDIALAAWGRLDTFDLEGDTVPTERISDFIKRYTGRGPEQIPGASGGI